MQPNKAFYTVKIYIIHPEFSGVHSIWNSLLAQIRFHFPNRFILETAVIE